MAKLWTAWKATEINLLRELYPHLSGRDLSSAFPRHTLVAIRKRAEAEGLTLKKRDWTAICAAHKPMVVS
jgi:hypothetical protein